MNATAPATRRHSTAILVIILLPEVLDGRLEPGKVFDATISLDDVPAGYRAMDTRESLKVLVQP